MFQIFCVSAENHTNLDPAVLATLKKLQDGYYGGARWIYTDTEVVFHVVLREISGQEEEFILNVDVMILL